MLLIPVKEIPALARMIVCNSSQVVVNSLFVSQWSYAMESRVTVAGKDLTTASLEEVIDYA